MKTFIRTCLIFLSLPLLFLAFLAYLDPFNFIRDESVKHQKLKKEISTKVNSRLYKLIEYERTPTEVVIFGDSRTDQLKSDYFENLLNKKVTNLSIAGGTLPEIISMFY